MRIVMFYHSIISDWNHGNAHFLRGIVSELLARGHDVRVYEPKDGWSFNNFIKEKGDLGVRQFRRVYPRLIGIQYDLGTLDLNEVLRDTDLVIVHEWNDPELVEKIGAHRARKNNFKLLFHDTHHRSVTNSRSMASYDISNYHGVLAFGDVIRALYLKNGWTRQAWTWHEAADARVFTPLPGVEKEGDLVWIGNWGDEERTEELHEFMIEPVRTLRLKAKVYGVRYPKALKILEDAGIEYGGWLPNFEVPRVLARFKVTVHIPRRPYKKVLPGIPTIRPFEALACGIPLVCSAWHDSEGLFTPGKDFLMAEDGAEMTEMLHYLLNNKRKAREMAQHGRRTVLARHTCFHRVNELLEICKELEMPSCVDSSSRAGAER